LRIVITGAAGFIGSHLTERLLLQNNCDVIGIDNFDPFYSKNIKLKNLGGFKDHKRFQFLELDLRDFSKTKEHLEKLLPTHIVHLAAKAGVRPSFSDPAGYMESNVSVATHLLHWVSSHPIQRFILGSSSSIYGNQAKIPFKVTEESLYPISPYGVSKLACEHIARVFAQTFSIPTVNLRFFTVYGPRQRPDLAIHKFVKAISEGSPIEIFGDGSTFRDYTYVSDIVDGIVSALFSPIDFSAGHFRTFNLGSRDPIKLQDLISHLESVMQKKANLRFLPMQRGDVDRTFADLTESHRDLGFSPKVKFREGLTVFWDWYQKNTPTHP